MARRRRGRWRSKTVAVPAARRHPRAQFGAERADTLLGGAALCADRGHGLGADLVPQPTRARRGERLHLERGVADHGHRGVDLLGGLVDLEAPPCRARPASTARRGRSDRRARRPRSRRTALAAVEHHGCRARHRVVARRVTVGALRAVRASVSTEPWPSSVSTPSTSSARPAGSDFLERLKMLTGVVLESGLECCGSVGLVRAEAACGPVPSVPPVTLRKRIRDLEGRVHVVLHDEPGRCGHRPAP